MRTRIPWTIGTIVVVALFAAVAVDAGAAGDSVGTTVKITEGGASHFAGTVSSKSAKCKKSRSVKLIYSTGGGGYGGYKGSSVVGETKTSSSGKWAVDGSFTTGLYQAKVKEKKVGKKTCRAAKTKLAQY